MSDSAAVLTTCMICFVMRKCRTRYLGKEDQGLVCSGDACRAKHIVRKTEARTASNAEKEAAKVLAREAKAQATAAKSAAARVARAAQGPRAKKKAAASSASFYLDPDDADGVDEEEVEVAPPQEMEVTDEPELQPSAAPASSRPARRNTFVDDMAGDEDGDGEELEEEGNATPDSMRDFVEVDHESESESASDGGAPPPPLTPHTSPLTSHPSLPRLQEETRRQETRRRPNLIF